MNLYLYKPFQKQLLKLDRAGGAASMACHQVHAAINNRRHRMPVTLPRTKHGETRIPHAVKYDLHGYYRLVVIQHADARLLVHVGSHDAVDCWLDTNRGAQFVVNKRGQMDFVRVEAVQLDLETLQDTLPDAPFLSGPVLTQLTPQAIASLGLSDTLRLFFDCLITFESLLEEEGLWQVIHDQVYASDSQRSATLDVVDHLRHGRLPEAIARIEAYSGEATADIAEVVAARRDNAAHVADARRAFAARLTHEAWHAYANRRLVATGRQPLPLWLDEGLAQVFETAPLEAGELRLDAPDPVRLKALEKLLAGRDAPPLVDLLRAGQSQFLIGHAGGRKASQQSYLMAWGLAFHLAVLEPVLTPASLAAICEPVEGADESARVVDFERLVGMPIAEFDTAWRRRMLTLRTR